MTNKARELSEDLLDEKEFYNEILDRVIMNPRFYLDNIDKPRSLQTFWFSFIRYYYKKKKDL